MLIVLFPLRVLGGLNRRPALSLLKGALDGES